MQQIADWLKKLGLPEYAERFAENGIDVSVLPHLTDQDLKDMGVLLGHRRRMLAAIGELSGKPAAGVRLRLVHLSGRRRSRPPWQWRRQSRQPANAATSRLCSAT